MRGYTAIKKGQWPFLAGQRAAGFIMPVQATAAIFGEKKWELFAIDTGYQLVAVLAMGVVLAILWQVKRDIGLQMLILKHREKQEIELSLLMKQV
ncbi:MAG: DUF1761 domain-containing protein [Candidatus Curtissbacteria bacterium]|nr:DUF1761 domain-containing protein [Candidatus Curtissbacteria bacterium]